MYQTLPHACPDDGTYELDLDYFRHAREQVVSTWDGGEPTKTERMYTDKLESLLGPTRAKDEPLADKHRDLARSIQVVYEQAFFNIGGLEDLERNWARIQKDYGV